MDLAPVASVGYVVFKAISSPRNVGYELAIILTKFHVSDKTASGIMNLLADLAIVPAMDDAASIGEEVEDVCKGGVLILLMNF